MSERTLTLPWGKEEIAVALPEAWHLSGVLEPSPRPGGGGSHPQPYPQLRPEHLQHGWPAHLAQPHAA